MCPSAVTHSIIDAEEAVMLTILSHTQALPYVLVYIYIYIHQL